LNAFDRQWARTAAFYERSLEWALHHRGRVVLASLLMLAITIPFALDLDRSVLPDVDQGEFRTRLELSRGTPLEVTAETAARLEQLFLADPAVDAVFTRIGKQVAIGGIDEE